MIRGFWIALVLTGCLAALSFAQTPAKPDETSSEKNKPAAEGQKPATVPPSSPNSFPVDTSTVPVMPSKTGPVGRDPNFSPLDSESGSGPVPLPGGDSDPVRSPDEPAADSGSAQDQDSSSSLKDIETLLPSPDADRPEKKSKKEPTHQEAASADIEVGNYYLERKNWKAALSRFQSAMVLDPENPEVYWGLAESEHHLGDFANARSHYQRVFEFDPDSRHGKEARKTLKDPALASAPGAVPTQPLPDTPR